MSQTPACLAKAWGCDTKQLDDAAGIDEGGRPIKTYDQDMKKWIKITNTMLTASAVERKGMEKVKELDALRKLQKQQGPGNSKFCMKEKTQAKSLTAKNKSKKSLEKEAYSEHRRQIGRRSREKWEEIAQEHNLMNKTKENTCGGIAEIQEKQNDG